MHILKFSYAEHAPSRNSVYCQCFLHISWKDVLFTCFVIMYLFFYQELERHGRTMRLPSIPERTIKFQRVEIQPGEEPLPIS